MQSINPTKYFTGRTEIIEKIKNRLKNLNSNIADHTTILGPKKIGKTQLAYKISEEIPNSIYIDCEHILGTPKNFAYRVLGIFLNKYLGENFSYFDKEIIKKKALDSDNKNVYELIIKIDDSDNVTILNSLFSFFGKLEDRYIIILDEFQKLLKLNRYRDINDILSIFKTNLENQTNVLYLTIVSEIKKFEDILKNSTLFGVFTYEKLSSLEKKESNILCTKILSEKSLIIEKESLEFLNYFLGYQPYYITLLSQKIIQKSKNRYINKETIIKLIFGELAEENGKLNQYFSYLFDNILIKVNESTKIKDALLFLAENKEVKTSELAKELIVIVAEAKNILNRLRDIDIVSKNNRFYQINIPLFALWIKSSYLKIIPKDRLEKQVEESYEEYISEKIDIKNIIKSLERKKIDKDIFRSNEDIIIPKFNKINSYATYSRYKDLITSEGLCLGIENWIIQIGYIESWDEKIKEIEKKENISIDKRWLIVDEISPEIIEFSKNNETYLSTKEDIKKLQKKI